MVQDLICAIQTGATAFLACLFRFSEGDETWRDWLLQIRVFPGQHGAGHSEILTGSPTGDDDPTQNPRGVRTSSTGGESLSRGIGHTHYNSGRHPICRAASLCDKANWLVVDEADPEAVRNPAAKRNIMQRLGLRTNNHDLCKL